MPAHLLTLEPADGETRVSLHTAGTLVAAHIVPADAIQSLISRADTLLSRDGGTYPTEGDLLAFGRELATGLLGSIHPLLIALRGRLWIVSTDADLLNLPLEIIPQADGSFLIEGGHLLLRRTAEQTAATAPAEAVTRPGPLRVLFMACSPQDENRLAFEKEEEAMVKLFLQQGTGVHLEIAESGTFQELMEKVGSFRPHIVHLSGHASLEENGSGYFLFENERGHGDFRSAGELTAQIFANSGVGMVFVSGCETARSGLAGLCQDLVGSGHVPLALGWGMPVIDSLATLFAISLFKRLAAGGSVDAAIDHARTELLAACPSRDARGNEILLTDFALPRLYGAGPLDSLFDKSLKADPPERPSYRPTILADNIVGLKEGFVGRRRILQRTLPVLRDADRGKTILLLTGIGGAGKSTLATRLANRLGHDGFRVVALRHRATESPDLFAIRLLQEIQVAAISSGNPPPASAALQGDAYTLAMRLRFAVEVLNALPILLVLDNLESLMPPPPAPPEWQDSDFGRFFTELTQRLTGVGRAIFTCRYVPAGFELPTKMETSPVLHFGIPDFTEADFFKCAEYHEGVSARLAAGEITRELLAEFHRKLGATPRFVTQALPVLAELSAAEIAASLAKIGDDSLTDDDGETDDQLRALQQKYFADLFLPGLYAALAPAHREALSRFAVCDLAVPLDGVAAVTDLDESGADAALTAWLRLGLVQCFSDRDGPALFAIYPLQRAFLAATEHLPATIRKVTHHALAVWLKGCSEADQEMNFGMSAMTVFFACLSHAHSAADTDHTVWSALNIGNRLIGASEFHAAAALAGELLRENRHPSFFKLLSDAFSHLGEWTEAHSLLEESIVGYGALSDHAGESAAWHQLGVIDLKRGDYQSARRNLLKSLQIERKIGGRDATSASWHALGTVHLARGKYSAARRFFRKSIRLAEVVGDHSGVASGLFCISNIDMESGDLMAARANIEAALGIARRYGNPQVEAAGLHQVACVDLREGKFAEARLNFENSIAIKQAIGDLEGEATSWHGLGTVDLHLLEYVISRREFEKALKIRRILGDKAGEAITWAQLSSLAFRAHGLSIVGLRLTIVAWLILKSIDNAGRQLAFENMRSMATDLNITQETLATEIQAALASYQADRGTALLAAAFPSATPT